ncbi:hypothetical protein [Hafnia paralvei]|uniref:hypothetical protein n=1 Tax=Hafnia paralvei TaxID=546367 RepID=UPI0029DB88A1|nr:hypothetical protein [Hafnia paralvei]MDX6839372.1 hypothetical protein [Hafnia paralvei]
MIGLTKKNSGLIGFVNASFSYKAINQDELREWAIKTVSENDIDKLPMYIIDLMEFSGYPKDIYKAIGFNPHWEHSHEQLKALYGITIRRGGWLSDIKTTPSEALDALRKHPEIEKLFRETFPFIRF